MAKSTSKSKSTARAGGKPSKGTPADGRLKVNKTKAK